MPCVLIGSCFLSLEAVLVVGLAQMEKRLQGRESMSPGRVLWGSQGVPHGGEAGAEAPGESVPRAGTGQGKREFQGGP